MQGERFVVDDSREVRQALLAQKHSYISRGFVDSNDPHGNISTNIISQA